MSQLLTHLSPTCLETLLLYRMVADKVGAPCYSFPLPGVLSQGALREPDFEVYCSFTVVVAK